METAQNKGAPMVPAAGDRVWGLFWALERRRQSNGYGANAISHQEIAACAGLYGVRLAPWEMRALDAMERTRIVWLNADEKDRAAPMTPDLFKSIFGKGG